MLLAEQFVSEHISSRACSRPLRPHKPNRSSWPIWVVLLVTLSMAGFCIWKAERVQTATVPISQIRLGDRVPGENPEGETDRAIAPCWVICEDETGAIADGREW